MPQCPKEEISREVDWSNNKRSPLPDWILSELLHIWHLIKLWHILYLAEIYIFNLLTREHLIEKSIIRIRKLWCRSWICYHKLCMCSCLNPLHSLIQFSLLQNILGLQISLGCCKEQMRECVVRCFVNYKHRKCMLSCYLVVPVQVTVQPVVLTGWEAELQNKAIKLKWLI